MSSFSGKIMLQAWMIAPETVRVMDALHDDGGDARFVGGCVRDALVNRKVIDIDIATPLKPEEVIDRLTRHKIDYAPTGLKHGTVTAIADGKPFEVTTLRRDVLTFGRHAEVAYTDDWQTDASRRDFTINAMFATREGDIFDPFGGIADLRLGRVVFVGDPEKRIQEDVLRILRFFRFYAYFGKGAPDAAALEACAKLAHLIPKLSAERIRQETLKTFDADAIPAVWRLMMENGIATHFLPEATNIAALERLVDLEARYDNAGRALQRLAVVLDTTLEGLRRTLQGLRLSAAQATALFKMVSGDPDISSDMSMEAVRRVVYHQGNDMTRSLLLLFAAKTQDEKGLPERFQMATAFRAPVFPVTGADVVKIGWPPGPRVGEVLKALEDWWVAGDFNVGRSACLDMLKKEFAPK